jgi:hypothetical protein
MNCQLKIALRHFCHRRNLSPLLFKAEPATRPPPSLPLSLSPPAVITQPQILHHRRSPARRRRRSSLSDQPPPPQTRGTRGNGSSRQLLDLVSWFPSILPLPSASIVSYWWGDGTPRNSAVGVGHVQAIYWAMTERDGNERHWLS